MPRPRLSFELTEAERKVLREFCDLAATRSEEEMDRIIERWRTEDGPQDLNDPQYRRAWERMKEIMRVVFWDQPDIVALFPPDP